jgi:toxin ParE1/3/4
MNKIELTPKAVEDLQEIKSYITDTLQNPQAAVNTVQKIIDCYEQLADQCKIGTQLETVIHLPNKYRFLVSGNYLIFYTIDASSVKIVRILYGKRDYVKVLFSNTEGTV